MLNNTPKSVVLGLYLVAGLLAINIVVSLSKSEFPAILPAAYAQRQAPIAGGAGIFVMPAQLSGNTWGCYLIDVDRSTLCCYQYFPGTRELQFVAARNYRNDTQLSNFNTTPSPAEIQNLVNKQNQGGPALPAPPKTDGQ
ncbi:MAG: hypothetical protein ABSH20_04830 [Tepidisphaeraceae bacterium]|jgi:hypothetical protein